MLRLSGLVQPEIDTYKSPDPIFPYGEALVSQGLEVRDMINGYGAVSRGLLWQLYDVWFDANYYDNILSVWTASESAVTTNWADTITLVTTWTPTQYGQWGEYTP